MMLDTSFVIDVLRRRNGAPELLETIGQESLSISAITVLELYQGLSAGQQQKIERMLAALDVIALDANIAKRAGALKLELQSRGIVIKIPDMIIAASALSRGETLIARDADFAKVPGLRVLKY